MFFNPKRRSKFPSETEFEAYTKNLYTTLQCGGDATPFDVLAVHAFSFLWVTEKSGQAQFLVYNDIAKADVIIAFMFLNQYRFLNGITFEPIQNQYRKIHIDKHIKLFRNQFPALQTTFLDMVQNRMEYYDKVFSSATSSPSDQMEKFVHEFQQILLQDIEDSKYIPFSESSPLIVVDVMESYRCQAEISTMVSSLDRVCSPVCNVINQGLLSLQKDAYEEKAEECKRFEAFCTAVRVGLRSYLQLHPSQIISDFTDALTSDLGLFFEENMKHEYSFSVSVSSGPNLEYVDFDIEHGVLEVSFGGSVYDPDVGSDSYTNWMYSLWTDGTDNGISNSSDFDVIISLLSSDTAKLSIGEPDEFYFDSELKDEYIEDDCESIDEDIDEELAEYGIIGNDDEYESEDEDSNCEVINSSQPSLFDGVQNAGTCQANTVPSTYLEKIYVTADQVFSEGITREEATYLLQYLEKYNTLIQLREKFHNLLPQFEEAERVLQEKRDLSEQMRVAYQEADQIAKSPKFTRVRSRSEELFSKH